MSITIVGEPLSLWSVWVGGFDESDPRTEDELDQEKLNLINYLNQFTDVTYEDENGDIDINFKPNWPNLKSLIDKLHQLIDYLRQRNLPYIMATTVFIKFDNSHDRGLLTVNSDNNLITLIYRDEGDVRLHEEQYPLLERKNKGVIITTVSSFNKLPFFETYHFQSRRFPLAAIKIETDFNLDTIIRAAVKDLNQNY